MTSITLLQHTLKILIKWYDTKLNFLALLLIILLRISATNVLYLLLIIRVIVFFNRKLILHI